MNRSLTICAAALAVVVACFAQNQPIPVPPTAKPPQPAPAAPGATHLTLPEAEQMALKQNPKISQAQYQARAYGEVVSEFRSAYFPTVAGNITAVGADDGSRLAAGALNNPVLYSRVGTGVTLSQLITDFGRTPSLVQSASLGAQAQQQALNFTRSDIVLQTDGAYLGVLRSRTELAVAKETVQNRQLVTDQVQALFQSKLKSSLDLTFAKVNLADAQLLLSAAENKVRSAEAELARVLGLPANTSFALVDPAIGEQRPGDSNSYVQQALQKRPDLLQRRLEVRASQEFATAEARLTRPSVGLFGSAGYVPAGVTQVPGTFGAVGVNLNIPVFNGGLYRARRYEADARAAAAEQGLHDLELQIRRDVRVAWLNANNAYERLGLTQQLLDQAKLALDLSQTRYRLGLSSIVELSQSQLQYTSAEIAQASARYDYEAQQSFLQYQAGLLH